MYGVGQVCFCMAPMRPLPGSEDKMSIAQPELKKIKRRLFVLPATGDREGDLSYGRSAVCVLRCVPSE